MKKLTRLLLFILTTAVSTSVFAVDEVIVQALFSGKAMLKIDGVNRMLADGQTSPEGVKLVSANSREAVIEIDGKQDVYEPGSAITTTYTKREKVEVRINSDTKGMYQTAGSINGIPVSFLVDTGASLVAMNSHHAKKLGIDFRVVGTESLAATASDVVKAYRVKLNTVTVGEVKLQNVEAMVMEGELPPNILLGMSFLGRVEMTNDQGMLKLKQKF